MTSLSAETSAQVFARVAGAAYIFVIVVAVFGVGLLDSKIVVSGDDAATAANIIANSLLFRISIVSVLIMYASVVVLSWALYLLLRAVSKYLALLALLLRFGEAVLGTATVLLSFVMLALLNGNVDSTFFQPGQLNALVGVFLNVRTAGLDIILMFVGLGGALFCYLFLTSRYVPWVLAAWGMVTYVSMLVLSLISILLPDHPAMLEIVLYALGGAFELVFGAWLLIKGVNVQQPDNHAAVPR